MFTSSRVRSQTASCLLPQCRASALTLQVAGVGEGPDVCDLVERAVVPPAGGGEVSAARRLQDDEDGAEQHRQPAEPEEQQQRPARPHPAEDGEQEPEHLGFPSLSLPHHSKIRMKSGAFSFSPRWREIL